MPARFRLPLAPLLLPLVLAACGGDSRPSLLLITLDTVRADRLGSYGYERPTTPVLDELAASGVVFETAIAQSAVTPVSHASILTGLDPPRHGLRSLHGGAGYALPAEVPTLAEWMRENGYDTAGFVSAFPVARHFGLERGFDTWDEDFAGHGGKGVVSEAGVVETGGAQRRADETTTRALDWLERRPDSRPFFLWVHYFDVHDPVLEPPAEYLARFPPASDSERDRLLALYDAELAFIDAEIGRLLRGLDEAGERERTVIAVLSDHGEGLGDHDWWYHALLYQEQVRIPFILSVPGSGFVGRVGTQVRSTDLVPTLFELLELRCPSADGCSVDGTSLVPLLAGQHQKPRLAYSESLNDLAAYAPLPLAGKSLYAVSDGRYKLIAHYEGTEPTTRELFDLEADPGETEDLAEQEPQSVERLARHLDALGTVSERPPLEPLDPATRARLQSLGYLD